MSTARRGSLYAAELVDQACTELYQPNCSQERIAAIQSFLCDFRSSSNPYSICKHLLEKSTSVPSQFQAIMVMKEAVLREWSTLDCSLITSLSDNLFQYVLNNDTAPTTIIRQIFATIATISKRGLFADGSGTGEVVLNTVINQCMLLAMNNNYQNQQQNNSWKGKRLSLYYCQALIEQFSASNGNGNVVLGMPISFHIRCHRQFEIYALKKIVEYICTILEELLALLVNNNTLNHDNTFMELVSMTSELLYICLNWDFSCSFNDNQFQHKILNIIQNEEDDSLNPDSSWRYVLIDSHMLDVISNVYINSRCIYKTIGLRGCLVLMGSLNLDNMKIDNNDKMLYFKKYWSIISYLLINPSYKYVNNQHQQLNMEQKMFLATELMDFSRILYSLSCNKSIMMIIQYINVEEFINMINQYLISLLSLLSDSSIYNDDLSDGIQYGFKTWNNVYNIISKHEPQSKLILNDISIKLLELYVNNNINNRDIMNEYYSNMMIIQNNNDDDDDDNDDDNELFVVCNCIENSSTLLNWYISNVMKRNNINNDYKILIYLIKILEYVMFGKTNNQNENNNNNDNNDMNNVFQLCNIWLQEEDCKTMNQQEQNNNNQKIDPLLCLTLLKFIIKWLFSIKHSLLINNNNNNNILQKDVYIFLIKLISKSLFNNNTNNNFTSKIQTLSLSLFNLLIDKPFVSNVLIIHNYYTLLLYLLSKEHFWLSLSLNNIKLLSSIIVISCGNQLQLENKENSYEINSYNILQQYELLFYNAIGLSKSELFNNPNNPNIYNNKLNNFIFTFLYGTTVCSKQCHYDISYGIWSVFLPYIDLLLSNNNNNMNMKNINIIIQFLIGIASYRLPYMSPELTQSFCVVVISAFNKISNQKDSLISNELNNNKAQDQLDDLLQSSTELLALIVCKESLNKYKNFNQFEFVIQGVFKGLVELFPIFDENILNYGEVSKNVFTILEISISCYPTQFMKCNSETIELFMNALLYSFNHHNKDVWTSGMNTISTISKFHRQIKHNDNNNQNNNSPFQSYLMMFLKKMLVSAMTEKLDLNEINIMGKNLYFVITSDMKAYNDISNELCVVYANNNAQIYNKLIICFEKLIHFNNNNNDEKQFQANILNFVATTRILIETK